MVTRRTHKSAAKKKLHGCVALMPVDGTAIRKKISREYESARAEIERVRKQLRRFEEDDKPAFRRWLHGQCGPIITLCRELEQRICAHEMILFRVQEASFFSGISPKKAYERVVRERER